MQRNQLEIAFGSDTKVWQLIFRFADFRDLLNWRLVSTEWKHRCDEIIGMRCRYSSERPAYFSKLDWWKGVRCSNPITVYVDKYRYKAGGLCGLWHNPDKKNVQFLYHINHPSNNCPKCTKPAEKEPNKFANLVPRETGDYIRSQRGRAKTVFSSKNG